MFRLTGIPPSDLKIWCNGFKLADNMTLSASGVNHGEMLMLMNLPKKPLNWINLKLNRKVLDPQPALPVKVR